MKTVAAVTAVIGAALTLLGFILLWQGSIAAFFWWLVAILFLAASLLIQWRLGMLKPREKRGPR